MQRISVIGLGTIGLPTAALFAKAGHAVHGVDLDPTVVARVRQGLADPHETGLQSLVAEQVAAGRLTAGPAPEPADVFIIAVPVALRPSGPDTSALEAATRALVPVLRRGNLVVVESTVPPTTTSRKVRPLLESGGLRVGRDVWLASCPERAMPGHVLREIVENARLLGADDPESLRRATSIYKSLVRGDLVETRILVAELVKLAENTYRDVNIALANDLADLCRELGANVWEVVALANRHPRVHLHQPGPGVGGYCIPVSPRFLMHSTGTTLPVISAARARNDSQPRRIADMALRLIDGPPRGAKVAVLGAAYKGGVAEARDSPVEPLVQLLAEAGLRVAVSDPKVLRFAHPIVPLKEALDGAHLMLVAVDHPEYRALPPADASALMAGRKVLDTRGLLDRDAWVRAGFDVVTLGIGAP